jgi:isohexenylglutaconyl-CoA hydratase
MVPDLDAAVAEVVADILQGAPGALAETKALIAAIGATVPDGYAAAGAAAFGRQAAGPEAAEGIASFMARRKPSWAEA